MRIKRISLGAIALSLTLTTMQAQQDFSGETVKENKSQTTGSTIQNEPLDGTVYIPEALEQDVAELLRSWNVDYYAKKDGGCPEFNQNVDIPDSVYVQRLARLPHIIEMPFNEPVRNCIKLYTERRRTHVQYMLGMADFYFPIIERILDENGLPLELKYLAIVESALNPTALSRAGASGLWQFILPTGKAYDLEINSLVDERRDPIKATYAACRYLKRMYTMFGDWNLVIASYNCGPGGVLKAIKRAGGARDYWAVYNYLPAETRSYVPLFIAATYAMNYYKEHSICPIATSLPLATDTIMIDKQLHLDQVAQVLNINIEQLRILNPEFKKDIIPGNYKTYGLKLPATTAYAFIEWQDSIYAYNADQYFTNRAYAGPGASSLASGNSPERLTHKVARGESMAKIANRYGVTVAQIKKWNGLKSSRVSTGKRLTLYIDSGGYLATNSSSSRTEKKEKGSDNSTSQTQTSAPAQTQTPVSADSSLNENKNEVAVSSSTAKTKNKSGDLAYKKYKVRKGDSFHTIAKKYPGLEAQELMRFNNVKSSSLRVGQIIKIPVG